MDELKKYLKSNLLTKLSRDKFSLEIFKIIFPEFKNIKIFSNPNKFAQIKIKEVDFIFLLSLLIIDNGDNLDYFIYKFNISKKDQKRLKVIDNFYKGQITSKSFSEKNLNKIFYYQGKQSVIDIVSYKLFYSKKVDQNLLNLIDQFKSRVLPVMPINAKFLIEKYEITEGKDLGIKLKNIEKEWVDNNFKLTEGQINKIVNH